MSGETAIVVPCYNEAARFDLRAFDAFLARSMGISFVLVDDGSSDDTLQVLELLQQRHPSRVAVLPIHVNTGKAEAVRCGILHALRGAPSIVGYWDADLATPLKAILDLRSMLWQRPELELVMGTRVALLGRKIRRSWKRHLLGRIFATAASLTLRLPVYDTQCGAKLFRVTPRTVRMFDEPFRARWIFDVELLARMQAGAAAAGSASLEQRICEYPLEQWEDVAGSRLRTRDFFIAAIDLATIGWRYRARQARHTAKSQPRTTRAAA